MRNTSRAIASALMLALTVSACGGHSSSLPNVGSSNSTSPDSSHTASSITAQTTPMISVPRTSGALAFSDLGRRSANAPVRVAITLRYNHQAQLDQLVQNIYNRNSGMYHHFLTPDQFNSYYGPTTQQEQSVVSALQAAGFTITKRYSNRTIVDAVAPSSTVERFFSTEMHSVNQGKDRKS